MERVDLDAPRPRLTAEPAAWLDAIESDETRRAYRRDALFLMRRLGLDTEPKLVCLDRRDAVRDRDLLQGLVDAGDASAGPGPPADGGGAVALRPPPAAAPRVSTTRSSSCGGRENREPAAPGVSAGGVRAADPPAAGRAGEPAVHWRSLTRRPARRRVPHRAVGHVATRASNRSSSASGEWEAPRRPSPTASHPAVLPGHAASRPREDAVPGRPAAATPDVVPCRCSPVAADDRRDPTARPCRVTRPPWCRRPGGVERMAERHARPPSSAAVPRSVIVRHDRHLIRRANAGTGWSASPAAPLRWSATASAAQGPGCASCGP